MTIPNLLSMEALLVEDGMDCRAGLPEGLRQQLDLARKREERAKQLQERSESILAEIAEHENQIAKCREQLRKVIQEFTSLENHRASAGV